MAESLAPASVVSFTKTRPGGSGKNPTTEYSALLRTVREAGLLRKRTGFYYLMFSLVTAALGGVITGFILLGDSWLQLLMAAALGIILTQYRVPGARGVAPAGVRVRPGERHRRARARQPFRRHQLRLVDDEAQPSSRQPQHRRQGSGYRARLRLVPGGGRREDARPLPLDDPAPGLPVLPGTALEGLNLHILGFKGSSATRRWKSAGSRSA